MYSTLIYCHPVLDSRHLMFCNESDVDRMAMQLGSSPTEVGVYIKMAMREWHNEGKSVEIFVRVSLERGGPSL